MVEEKKVRKKIQEIAKDLRKDIWATWYAVEDLFNEHAPFEENIEKMKKKIVEGYSDVEPEDVGLEREVAGKGAKEYVERLKESEISIPSEEESSSGEESELSEKEKLEKAIKEVKEE